jgi:hypothetical protein
MIIGVTHDQDGRVVQRLSVSTKISIGLPPNGDRNYLTKLDHFVFLRKKKSANRIGWEVDPELTEHYGEECHDLHIMRTPTRRGSITKSVAFEQAQSADMRSVPFSAAHNDSPGFLQRPGTDCRRPWR